jgi:hypothetical protein
MSLYVKEDFRKRKDGLCLGLNRSFGGEGLNYPLLMRPVQSQEETVFTFSEILFHL